MEVVQHVFLEQLGVQLGNAVDGVAADTGEMRHAHVPFAALVDERQARDALLVAQEAHACLVEEARVDLIDDLEVSRQHPAEHAERPALERFRQKRVIGVGEGALRDVPGLFPRHLVLVDQKTHELRDGDGRMGVVQLHRELLWKLIERQTLTTHDAQHVLQRARDEEVLLLEPELLALQGLVVRIEHLGQVFRDDLPVHGAVVVAAVEHREVERFRRLGAPQAQRVRGVVAIAEDRGVVRDAEYDLVGYPAHADLPAFVGEVLGAAAEPHLLRPLRPHELPGIAEAQPLVGLLDLPAVDDVLVEDAELVADAVAERGNLEGRQRVEKARGEAAETAVAEPGLLLLLQQLVEIETEPRDRALHEIVNAEVDQVVAEVRSHQELGREIGDGARALLGVGSRGAHPPVQQVIAHHVGKRHVVVALRGKRRKLALHVEEMIEELTLDRLAGEGGCFADRTFGGRGDDALIHAVPFSSKRHADGCAPTASSVRMGCDVGPVRRLVRSTPRPTTHAAIAALPGCGHWRRRSRDAAHRRVASRGARARVWCAGAMGPGYVMET